jgi:ribonuclease inhibitor
MSAPLVIDVSDASNAHELHALLARQLSFPDYYGHNWDAFWDCVTDPEQSKMPAVLHVVGFSALASRLPREAQLFQQCLAELQQERPELQVVLAQQGIQTDGPASGGSAA